MVLPAVAIFVAVAAGVGPLAVRELLSGAEAAAVAAAVDAGLRPGLAWTLNSFVSLGSHMCLRPPALRLARFTVM